MSRKRKNEEEEAVQEKVEPDYDSDDERPKFQDLVGSSWKRQLAEKFSNHSIVSKVPPKAKLDHMPQHLIPQILSKMPIEPFLNSIKTCRKLSNPDMLKLVQPRAHYSPNYVYKQLTVKFNRKTKKFTFIVENDSRKQHFTHEKCSSFLTTAVLFHFDSIVLRIGELKTTEKVNDVLSRLKSLLGNKHLTVHSLFVEDNFPIGNEFKKLIRFDRVCLSPKRQQLITFDHLKGAFPAFLSCAVILFALCRGDWFDCLFDLIEILQKESTRGRKFRCISLVEKETKDPTMFELRPICMPLVYKFYEEIGLLHPGAAFPVDRQRYITKSKDEIIIIVIERYQHGKPNYISLKFFSSMKKVFRDEWKEVLPFPLDDYQSEIEEASISKFCEIMEKARKDWESKQQVDAAKQ